MKTPREIEIQDWIINTLSDKFNISPFSVTCTFAVKSEGLVSITFWIPTDLNEFLGILDYASQCCKSDFIILPETNTVILMGFALINLYTKL